MTREEVAEGIEKCKRSVKFVYGLPERTSFTPSEVCSLLIEYGQCDTRFRLGETIRYAPYEVGMILEGFAEEVRRTEAAV